MRQLPDRLDQLPWLLMRTTAEVLEEHLDAFGAARPDYVITDSVAPWGQWVGEVLGVPVVTSISTFAVNRHVLARAFALGVRPTSAGIMWSKLRHMTKALVLERRLRRRYNVRALGMRRLVFGHSGLNLVYTSAYFQPRADTFDHRFQFVGPLIAPRVDTGSFPWSEVQHPVVVYVSLGTLFNTDAAFYRTCFDAFGREDAQVILSIGTNTPAASLGAVPPNFILRPQVPQLDVLDRARVFVTHGGMNSVSESLLKGVPLVVIPQMGEQKIVGRRVEELGAGEYLDKSAVTAATLREAVRRVLADDRFRTQAAVVRESFLAAGGAPRGADAIRAFISSSETV
jgi:MGT family glycosyltransferase